MNKPSASQITSSPWVISATMNSLRPERSRSRARTETSNPTGTGGAVVDCQPAGERRDAVHHQDVAHHVVEHGGHDAAVGAPRCPFEGRAEVELGDRLLAVARTWIPTPIGLA